MFKGKKLATVASAGVLGLTGLVGGGTSASAATLDTATSKDFIVNVVEPELGISFVADKYNLDVVPGVGSAVTNYEIENTGNISQKYTISVADTGALKLQDKAVRNTGMSEEDKQDEGIKGYVSVKERTVGYLNKTGKEIANYQEPGTKQEGSLGFELTRDTETGAYNIGILIKAESQELE